MTHTVILDDQELDVLKKIFTQIVPTTLIVNPVSKPKKISRVEQMSIDRREYRAKKALRKGN